MIYTSREVYEFISRQTSDPIVERKTCTISGQPFAIYQSDLDFYAKISPTFNSQKFQIPTPTLCPEERQRRRLSFRNERKLYRRQCDATKKSIISIYSPDKPYKVYDQKIRRSDSRDPMDYGMDFDFSKTFTENIRELMIQVPRLSLFSQRSENSEYTNQAYDNKSCYMCFAVGDSENLLYSECAKNNNDCIDIGYTHQSFLSYESIDSENIYKCKFMNECTNCKESIYCENCHGCDSCIGCISLTNKKYCIFNKQYTKEEYEKYIKNTNNNKIKYDFIQFKSTIPKLSIKNIQSNKIVANNLNNSNESTLVFDGFEINQSKYSSRIFISQQCVDCYGMGGSEYVYEGISVENLKYSIFNTVVSDSSFIYFSDLCFNSNNLFGCTGLRNKSYCIFNKQYTKEAYEKQVANIIAHMQNTGERGEFFHPSLSPFGYNETVAQEYFPLPQDLVGTHGNASDPVADMLPHVPTDYSKCGYHRSTYNADPSLPAGVQTVERKNYSDEQWDNLISQENLETQVFLCSVSGRPYRLQKAEITFYRKHDLPIPDKHPDIRHEERMKRRPGRTLFLRNCDCCEKEMLSVYPQTYEGKVYCEECYQQEVYG